MRKGNLSIEKHHDEHDRHRINVARELRSPPVTDELQFLHLTCRSTIAAPDPTGAAYTAPLHEITQSPDSLPRALEAVVLPATEHAGKDVAAEDKSARDVVDPTFGCKSPDSPSFGSA